MKTRDKIVHTSLNLFNEQGERNITTNHIAAFLNISPGNLYYHFRNKEDIISSIFSLYESHLDSGFQLYKTDNVDVPLLIGYFDTMFDTLWKFRFLYANLTDILNRDQSLLKRYQIVQQKALQRSSNILAKLKHDNMLDIDPEKVTPLADTMRMIACFWVDYKQTHSIYGTICQASLYEGLLRVIMIFKAHATQDSKQVFTQLEHHYQRLAAGQTTKNSDAKPCSCMPEPLTLVV
ncbi:TetR/AcrR family transcriptional regulator [Shewanella sp. SR44-3]|uniref:TetR/AcrR family transcriptional regulator n=1 Tax=unclassified Shewanella TaxID=196818 RepID=UPI0015F9042C|nr:TetR/AcrR family transcriptional regulator [Shewanella sp. SR44-3]MBB1268422.1 TetR/AcrR family transcriptional regulator [Shewanella sp. SR44-3]